MRPFWALFASKSMNRAGRWCSRPQPCSAWAGFSSTSRRSMKPKSSKRLESDSADTRIQWLRNLGIAEQPSSISLMIASWNHPFILLLVSMWAIGRGSAAVAAEVERGTLDLILSRPVSRWAYLASQVIVAISGTGDPCLRPPPGRGRRDPLQRLSRAARSLENGAAGDQSRCAGPAYLRIYLAGFGARPRPMASHVDRLVPDLGRLHCVLSSP